MLLYLSFFCAPTKKRMRLKRKSRKKRNLLRNTTKNSRKRPKRPKRTTRKHRSIIRTKINQAKTQLPQVTIPKYQNNIRKIKTPNSFHQYFIKLLNKPIGYVPLLVLLTVLIFWFFLKNKINTALFSRKNKKPNVDESKKPVIGGKKSDDKPPKLDDQNPEVKVEVEDLNPEVEDKNQSSEFVFQKTDHQKWE